MRFVLLMILFPSLCFSQKQGNVWYFGDHVGLDFSTGNPITLVNGQTDASVEGTAVMSDSSGALLFYSDGSKIWNRNHQIMPNGDSLLGHWSSTQSSLIIPLPGSSKLFYVFTTDAFYQNNLRYGFRYSIVDMCLDNGLGDIVLNQKNILLLDTVSEKLTAVRHSNGIDYWIITHKYFSDAFYSYHLTAAGITDTVISHVGSTHPIAPLATGGAIGQLKASPNGEKLAIVNGNGSSIAEYFDFNKGSGMVTNCVSIQANLNWNYYGVSFSPDNTKLYIACWLNGNGIYQFDLNAGGGNPNAVMASKTQIANNNYNYLGLQLANNGKIYVTRSPFGVNTYLDVINYPNNLGVACNYNDSAVSLAGHTSGFGFPNFVDSYDYSNTFFNCLTGVDEVSRNNNVVVYPNPFYDELYINFELDEFVQVNLYDIALRKVLSGSFDTSTSINTSSLSSGVYLYDLRSKSGVVKQGKIVKN
jgi:hypothetical protein